MSLIPPWLKLALLAALAAAVAAAIAWAVHHEREIGRAEVRAQVAREAADQAAINARETQRRLDRQQEIQRVHDQALAGAAADAARARDAAGRLQQRVDELVAAACPAAGDSAAVGDGQAACDPARVLADLQRRVDERAGLLADYADRARLAGEQCAREYDALSPAP